MSADPKLDPAPSEGVTDFGRWMALAAALLGWMFDGAEMGLFSMVGRPAVRDLLSEGGKLPVTDGEVGKYFGVVIAMFLVGAASGGVLFGWLGDRIGRVRAMSLSVLVYAIFTGLCGFATAAWQVALLRFIAALGMGGEWALGVALVMEVWPNRSRAFMAGLIGAAANVGYLVVALAGMGLNAFIQDFASVLLNCGLPTETVARLTSYDGWRLMMLLGTTPAILTVFFRIFVPESHKWAAEDEKGTTSHWVTADLLGVVIGALGPGLIIVAMVLDWHWALKVAATLIGLAVACVGYTYPVLRFLQRQDDGSGKIRVRETLSLMLLGACLSGVALLGTWGATQWAPSWAGKMVEAEAKVAQQASAAAGQAAPPPVKNAKEWTLLWTSVGAILGTLIAAIVGDWLGRRVTYFALCFLSLLSCWGLYQLNTSYGPPFLFWVGLQGFFTASFYGWLPLYLPELFGTSVRATGQGFAFNFGRILAAVGALNTGALMAFFGDDFAKAASWMCLIYLVGMILIWFAPETKGEPLPE